MKKRPAITGIVVEYNPFHNGHIYHIQKAREISQCDVLIAVMSPHFVQRGEPAFIDKWARTEAALNHGVDIVIELPTYFALQSADYFAKASVELLNIMHVDTLVFGSESNDLDTIRNAFSFQPEVGRSYAHQMGGAVLSNDILGYQYIQTAQALGIKAIPIQRTNGYHDTSVEATIASATSIRLNHRVRDVSHTTPLNLDATTIHDISEYETLIRYALKTKTRAHLQSILLVDEGIENLLVKHSNLPLDALIATCTSKRYTTSRIQRTLMNILLDIKKDDVKPPAQARVLGMNMRGQAYLKDIKNDANYVTSFKQYDLKDLELKATTIYGMVKDNKTMNALIQDEISKLILKR